MRKRWPWITHEDWMLIVGLCVCVIQNSWSSIEVAGKEHFDNDFWDIPIVPGRTEDFGK